MASIRKRTSSDGTDVFHVQVRLRGFPTQTASFPRLTDAKRWIASTESAIREGRHFKTSESKKHTFNDLANRYAELVVPRKKHTRQDLQHLGYWREQLGAFLLADINSAILIEARQRLQNGKRSDSTINRYWATLSHAFSLASTEWEWLQDNPCRKIKKFKEPRGIIRFLSEDEIDRLVNACQLNRNHDLYHAVMLSLSTGARHAEIMSLKWSQIDFRRQVITLYETKNDEIRSLSLSSFALESLQERLQTRRMDTELVFPQSNHPQRHIDLRRAFENVLKECGIINFRWHDLRHTAASYLAMNGASLAEIAEVLGHKTLAMVKRYAHLSQAHTARVVESMNRAMFKEHKRAG